MAIFYYKQGFYDYDTDGIVPEGAIEISQEQHVELLNALNTGCLVLDDLTVTPRRPSPEYDWDGTKWTVNNVRADEMRAEQQSEMWARIKQKRHDNLRHGVYVKSVGKWLHSDDDSRAQYTFMRTMATLPENMLWKTMDNRFIPMTRELLDELSMQLLLDEQADFANAERHRAAMLQADNPLDYDYSSGWTAIFQAA